MRNRSILSGLTIAAVSLGVAAPALAHAPVVGRTPAPNSTTSKVTSVKLTFGDTVITGLISLTKGGAPVKPKTSGLNAKKTVLRETFATPLSKGVYTVSWRALADDGHHQAGTWKFTVK